MNSLTIPDKRAVQGRVTGYLESFLHAAAGPPNPKKPRVVLWQGSVADVREGVALNADDPAICPSTDEDMVELLHHARPLLRARGFLLSPQAIDVDSTVKVTSRPAGYKPSWQRSAA